MCVTRALLFVSLLFVVSFFIACSDLKPGQCEGWNDCPRYLDDNLCMVRDNCSKPGDRYDEVGQCTYKSLCDDQNPCTVDRCDPVTASCTYELLPSSADGVCNDHNNCTREDRCINGECRGVPINECDDGNMCTVDYVVEVGSGNPKSCQCRSAPVHGSQCNDPRFSESGVGADCLWNCVRGICLPLK